MSNMQPTQGPGYRIDLGCGGAKKAGFLGLDCVAAPGVDHVLDLTRDRYPFKDGTVSHVFSSHFLEHIEAPNHVLAEVGRICREGAQIEIWTPYAFSNEAFIYGHKAYLTEEMWLHFCCIHRDVHLPLLGGRWLLCNLHYVIEERIERELAARGVSLDFAVRYFKGVVLEFGVEIEFHRDLSIPARTPLRTYSYTRTGPRFRLKPKNSLGYLARRAFGWLKRAAGKALTTNR